MLYIFKDINIINNVFRCFPLEIQLYSLFTYIITQNNDVLYLFFSVLLSELSSPIFKEIISAYTSRHNRWKQVYRGAIELPEIAYGAADNSGLSKYLENQVEKVAINYMPLDEEIRKIWEELSEKYEEYLYNYKSIIQ